MFENETKQINYTKPHIQKGLQNPSRKRNVSKPNLDTP